MKRDNKGRFVKGNVPWNKGVTDLWLSPAGQFKKGKHAVNFKGYYKVHVVNHKRDGLQYYVTTPERIKHTSRGRTYYTRKRISLAKHLWQTHYGPVPPGKIVYNTKPDKMPCIENLKLITRSDLVKINHTKGLTKNK